MGHAERRLKAIPAGRRSRGLAAMLLALAWLCAPLSASGESIKIGVLRTTGAGPLYLAKEKGYFAAEGLDAELVYFEAAQPVAVATASGSIDFGLTGLTAGFYSLAAQGELRIIGAYYREAPNFQATAYVASNRAYEAGLRSVKDLAGHSVAVTQIGSTLHYMVGLAAEKYGFDMASVRVLALQSSPNEVSAVTGGQADAALIISSFVTPAVQRGDVKLIGWVGDETPFQLGAALAATKMVDERPRTVERFLRAYHRSVREFHDAFSGSDGARRDGPEAPAIYAILSRYVGQPLDAVKLSIPYFDAEGRLDVKDVRHQIAWHKAQGLLKGPVDGETLIDRRYVVPFPSE